MNLEDHAEGLKFLIRDPDLRKFLLAAATTCGNVMEAFAETC
jgi:hypothetical protein